ncbi:uncharacterized protein A4U43_C01F28460 [Asparagus officinalis]|uniref:Protein kinase domain-containing protein n=1 Tax=Asparagus officinalis TaxID=4686 RepID=A0A5P1FTG0_ASPOF|nr:LEAF RUST 10 DISEASE-RESISTANCE LOCUS RECEPTOR-LIKE PROTEIN KINASE-like 2.5 [Asparagus officinalis]ONK81382.1 uncharacterized protein A4U43_C01F28460 [Asparagus officinalis]
MKFVLCSILTFLLFSSTGLALYPFKEVCSSSCGQLKNIHPPFRLKGDASYCGDPEYELICDQNHTILNLSFGKYYVASISYNPNELQVVDVGLTSGVCRFPLGSITPRTIKNSKRYELISPHWASFVNCVDGIQDDTNYRPVPCLHKNSSFVYVVSGYEVKELKPSCGFSAMIPTDSFMNKSLNEDVFQLLQRGFIISWIGDSKTFGYCFAAYFRASTSVFNSGGIYQSIVYIILLEIGFVECVYESKDPSGLPLAIAFILALNLFLFTLVGRFIFAPICMGVFIRYQYFHMLVPVNAIEKFLRTQKPLTPTRYAYTEISTITNHFKEKLGQGGFGSVFKGKLPNGQLVAVKMLGNSNCNGEDFINEVSTIGRIHHKNIVQLLGYCSDGSKRALVYEYMPKGSLDKYIFSSSNGTSRHTFTWEERKEISLGVAQGIDYLHRGCDMKIVHFDIKPQNILLDEFFNPKVSDFGLARLYPKENSIVSISVARGTIGYIAPELISRNFGVISHKSDVYSYGMLLLEIAGGRRNVNLQADDSSQIYYPSWIYDRIDQREKLVVCEITEIGEADRELLGEINEVERQLCKVGLWCIQMQPQNRPSMSKVVEMLESDAENLPMPPKPFFSSIVSTPAEQFYMDSSVSELSIISEQD